MENSKKYSVVVIGSGNVAEAVALAVAECDGVELREVVARNRERGEAIAAMCATAWQGDFAQAAEADLYIIAVSDRAVAEVANTVRRAEGSTVVHTAGSVECSVLGEGSCGVLYPFQTFTAGRRVDFSQVPLFVEGSDAATTQKILHIAHLLSHRVYRADSSQRREVHLTGVMACNFVNALYAMAADRLREYADLPFDVLRPLIEQTAHNAIASEHPREVQTGPAVRGDFSVAERHTAMLQSEQQKQIYNLLTQYIWQTSKKI